MSILTSRTLSLAWKGRLSADLREGQEPAAACIAALDEPVALGLDAQRLSHQWLDGIAAAQGVAQVGLDGAEEAGAPLAVGRQPMDIWNRITGRTLVR